MNPNRPSFLALFFWPYLVPLFRLLCELGNAGLWGEVFASSLDAARAVFGVAVGGNA